MPKIKPDEPAPSGRGKEHKPPAALPKQAVTSPKPAARSAETKPVLLQAKEAGQSKAAAKSSDAKSSPEDEKHAAVLKQINDAFFAFHFYPVAVKKDAKEDAVKKIKELYATGDEPVRQLILYQFHEHLSKIDELKVMHNYEFFRRQKPDTDPSQLRMQVYRAIFNYHYSLEGLLEFIKVLGELEGDDAAKLLTYHFSFLSAIENEASHVLRAAILDTLAQSKSLYALHALLSYAKFVSSERLLGRILPALAAWNQRLVTLDIPAEKKAELQKSISDMLTIEFGDSHYG